MRIGKVIGAISSGLQPLEDPCEFTSHFHTLALWYEEWRVKCVETGVPSSIYLRSEARC